MARNLEEEITAYLAVQSGCASAASTVSMPPPEDCPGYVKGAFLVSKIHLISVLILLVFLVFCLQMIVQAKNPH
jgi:hypothetical protein